jgi:DNA-binding response OmpR family regulator
LTAGIFVLVEPTVNSQKRTRCLDLGADLVLGKPITTAELLARLRALTRRNVKVESNGYHVGELKINPLERTVHRGEKLIRLTPREFELLEFLVNRRGKIVSRMMIREHLFKSIAGYGSNVVDVYIRYLRRKIDKGFPQALILTHWGKGYEFRGVAEVE